MSLVKTNALQKADGTKEVSIDDIHAMVNSNARYTYINTYSASAAANLDITGLTNAYDEYLLVVRDLLPSNDMTDLELLLSTNNGSSFLTTGYDYSHDETMNVSAGGNRAQNASAAKLTDYQSNVAGDGCSGEIRIINPDTAVLGATKHRSKIVGRHADTWGTAWDGGGQNRTSSAINAARLRFSSGNITGTVYLIGIKNVL